MVSLLLDHNHNEIKHNVKMTTVFHLISYHFMAKCVTNNKIMFSLLLRLQLAIPQKTFPFLIMSNQYKAWSIPCT